MQVRKWPSGAVNTLGPAPKEQPPMHPQSKQCAQCSDTFHPTPGRSKAQWERQQFCKAACANTWRASQQRPFASTQRAWAAAWERHRLKQDRAEAQSDDKRQHRRQRKVRQATRPLSESRQFIAGYCPGCGEGWVDYLLRKPSGYCNRCQDRRWAADSRHKRRAWKAAANVVEVISPDLVFRRDRYRCQLCGIKTKNTVPHPQAPTVDHIVPLSQGGDHSYLNVQCACFSCNSRKGAGQANDQLRLVA